MAEAGSLLKNMRILVVDDEADILDTIEEVLDQARVDRAQDYASASAKIKQNKYDLAILDIMGVSGLKLLEEAVERGLPAVMLTAHAVNPEALMASIRQGALSYLPKEELAELDRFLEDLLAARAGGTPPWKLLFDRLGGFFDQRFGEGWQDRDRAFWSEFSRTYAVGKGLQARMLKDETVRSRGI